MHRTDIFLLKMWAYQSVWLSPQLLSVMLFL